MTMELCFTWKDQITQCLTCWSILQGCADTTDQIQTKLEIHMCKKSAIFFSWNLQNKEEEALYSNSMDRPRSMKAMR